MSYPAYKPPFFLNSGLAMTVYVARKAGQNWEKTVKEPEPPYQDTLFSGAGGVPIFGQIAIPENPRGTFVATYGITGDLKNQWFLRLLGRKAFARGYAVVLFDWRAHGKTAQLSSTLTSDGLYEGEDFVRIAATAKTLGCPAPFWLAGYSLGGQLSLWGIKTSQDLNLCQEVGLSAEDIAGGVAICPSLDSNRSLSYLIGHPIGKYLEKAIARELKRLAWQLKDYHPQAFDSEAIKRANSIWGFDNELVIERLGFPSVESYYDASSGLHLLPHIHKPTLILYAADDPMFDPSLVPEIRSLCAANSAIDLILTRHGGHVGYISSTPCQKRAGDPDRWWAWNRVLQWCDRPQS